jgi:hypothetical protein
MNIRRRLVHSFLLTSLLITFWSGPATAQQSFRLIPEIRFLLGMEWGQLWLAGDMLIPAGGRPGSGTRVDVSEDLGMDLGDASSIVFQAAILDNHRLDSDYLLYSPTALKRIDRTFVFHNQTYLPGTSVECRLDFNWLRFSYGYKALDMASWQIFPRVGVHHVRCTKTLNGESKEGGVSSNTRSLDGTYPVLGVETRYGLPYGIDVGLELEGMHLITRGFIALSRLRAQWAFHPDISISVSASNRLVQYVEDNQPLNNEWFYSLSGWSAGVSFGF